MKRLLFIAPHRPGRSPSQRFRFEQYLDHLSQNGYDCRISFLISGKDDLIFYAPGKYIQKIWLFFKYLYKRIADLLSAGNYDIIFIQREAFFFGPPVFEYFFSKTRAKLVFDFDDSIWLPNVSEANKKLNWIKNYKKTSRIISYADLVIAGNTYLADYAKPFNKIVVIIPTTIDTSVYQKNESFNKDKICIGWIGSKTTIKHFEFAIPFLLEIKNKYAEKVYFKVIGDGSYHNEMLDIKGIIWKKETEIHELSELDIGIMPLPDDEWTKGKCGCKGLQYMALEIPAIMSPVGVNKEIISDGHNGFLADSKEEWVMKLSRLIDSEILRIHIGKNGCKTVKEKYSMNSQKFLFLNFLDNLINK